MKLILCLFASLVIGTGSYAQTIKAQPTLKDQYSKKVGNLRMSTSTLALGKVLTNEIKMDTVRILNSGSTEMELTIQTRTDYFSTQLSSTKLTAGQEGWIAIAYNVGKRNDYGFVLDRILINTNDKEQPQKNINVTATIAEYFSPEVDSLAPKAKLTETIYGYGTIHQGDKVNHDFLITNDGQKPLIIRKAKCTCGCIKISTTKTEINPGESAMIHVDFDSFGKEGKDSRIINVFLNDPTMPEVKLEVSGTVVK